MTVNVSQDDLLDAIRKAMSPSHEAGEGFRTVRELTESTGKGEDRVRKALRLLQREGRLETRLVQRTAIDGRPQAVPAYRFKPAA